MSTSSVYLVTIQQWVSDLEFFSPIHIDTNFKKQLDGTVCKQLAMGFHWLSGYNCAYIYTSSGNLFAPFSLIHLHIYAEHKICSKPV